jgi:membrane protein EpsK
MSDPHLPLDPLDTPPPPPEDDGAPAAPPPARRRGRAIVNVVANSANFAVNVLIGLWLTPYIIRHLGVIAYGFVPLATSLVTYLDVITISLNAVVGRFLTVAVEQQRSRYASQLFSTSVLANTGIVMVLWLPALLLIAHVDRLIHVPPEYVPDVQRLFLCAVGVFTLNAVGNTFQAATFCMSRFDLRNAAAIAGAATRVGVIVTAFALVGPHLWHVGLGIGGDALVVFIGAVVIHRYLLPTLRLRPADFSWLALKQLVSAGVWLMLGRLGGILSVQLDALIVNLVLGAKAGGQYGALLPWPMMLRALAGVISTGLAPNIVYLHAHGRRDEMVLYVRRSVKMLGLIIALPTGVICGLAPPLLHTWLGAEFVPLAPLMVLMAVHLCVNLSLWPLFELMVATNDVQVPGLTTIGLGVLNVGLAVLLAGPPVHLGMYGVALAGGLMLTVRSLVFGLYAAQLVQGRPGLFFRELLPITGAFAGLAGLCVGLTRLVALHGWAQLLMAVTGVGVLYAVVLFGLVLTTEERALLTRLVTRKGRSDS